MKEIERKDVFNDFVPLTAPSRIGSWSVSPVLEPDLDDPHVEPGVGRQLLPHVPRRLGARLVRVLQHLHLPRRDRGARPLVAVHAVAVVRRCKQE